MLRDTQPAAHTKLSETAYFTIIFLMHSTYALQFSGSYRLSQSQRMVFSTSVYYFDVIMDKMIEVFSNKRYLGSSFLQVASMIRSPIFVCVIFSNFCEQVTYEPLGSNLPGCLDLDIYCQLPSLEYLSPYLEVLSLREGCGIQHSGTWTL